MRIQVVGPVTGLPQGNRPQFAATTRRLRAAGHTVTDPTEKYSTPGEEPVPVGSPRYEEIMRACFTDMKQQDAICTLTGWQNSSGAVREVELAKKLDLVIESEDYFLEQSVQYLKWTGDPECEPVRAYDGDAGFDLFVSEDTYIPYRAFADVPLGISVQLPEGVWAMLTGRSSTIRRRGLLVTQGVIDNGYRGALYAGVQNMAREAVKVERGERIAQLIPFSLVTPHPMEVAELSLSDRGINGFGSSGR